MSWFVSVSISPAAGGVEFEGAVESGGGRPTSSPEIAVDYRQYLCRQHLYTPVRTRR